MLVYQRVITVHGDFLLPQCITRGCPEVMTGWLGSWHTKPWAGIPHGERPCKVCKARDFPDWGFSPARITYQDSYPLVMTNITMERSTIYSDFSHEKLGFSIAMWNYQSTNVIPSDPQVNSVQGGCASWLHWISWANVTVGSVGYGLVGDWMDITDISQMDHDGSIASNPKLKKRCTGDPQANTMIYPLVN